MQGRVEQALPEVESRLAQVDAWWQQHRAGQIVPQTPDPETLVRTLVNALDIARRAYLARPDWEPALCRIEAILEVKRAVGRPAADIAITRINRAEILGQLGRYPEAKAELEDCLQVFQNHPAGRAQALHCLAAVLDQQGDVREAIIQERRALALSQQLPSPRLRAMSHHNLANYLDRGGTPPALAESRRHRLAALVYEVVTGQGLQISPQLRCLLPRCPSCRHRAGRTMRGRAARRSRLPFARRLAPTATRRHGRGADRRGSGAGASPPGGDETELTAD